MTEPNSGDLIKVGATALLASIVRTLVPLIVGTLVAWFTKIGVPVDEADVESVVNGLVSFGVAALYYVIARLLETFASSKFGWLLGFANAPQYKAAPKSLPPTV